MHSRAGRKATVLFAQLSVLQFRDTWFAKRVKRPLPVMGIVAKFPVAFLAAGMWALDFAV
jgi:hypothetical protein